LLNSHGKVLEWLPAPSPSPGTLLAPRLRLLSCAGPDPAAVQSTAAAAAFVTTSCCYFCSSALIRYILCSAQALQSARIKLSKNAHLR